jgi:hypothetical protein
MRTAIALVVLFGGMFAEALYQRKLERARVFAMQLRAAVHATSRGIKAYTQLIREASLSMQQMAEAIRVTALALSRAGISTATVNDTLTFPQHLEAPVGEASIVPITADDECWRCWVQEVPVNDDLGLCPECKAELQGGEGPGEFRPPWVIAGDEAVERDRAAHPELYA